MMITIPEYLYKYRSFDKNEYWKDIFENNRLYMASPLGFNDPFEGQLFPFTSGSAGNTINLHVGGFNRDVGQFLNEYKVLSLTGNIRNKAMWAYYADNYNGFAIQFKTNGGFSSAQRVIYRSDNEKIPCQDVHGRLEAKDVVQKCLLYKSDDWRGENEFRIIQEGEREEKIFFNFNPDDIVSVIIGGTQNKFAWKYDSFSNIDEDEVERIQEAKGELIDICKDKGILIRYMWLVPIYSRIEFYSRKEPRWDGSSYRDFIDTDI